MTAEGEVVVGQAAERRAVTEPDRVTRALLTRVGDDTAVLLGGQLYPAENLLAAFVAWIADVVADAEGGHAERIAVTHPPEWGSYRRGLLRDALHAAGLPGVLLLPTVVAAAEARHAREPVRPGAALVVGLAGGRHVEHAVLHRGPAAFEMVAHLPAVDAEAGVRLDDLLAAHILAEAPTLSPDQTVPDLRAAAGPVDPASLSPSAMAAFRAACTTAKERLSVATEVRVPLPHIPDDLLVTRACFEELARPALSAIARQMTALVASAPADAGAVLAGGTARVPLLAALAGCPVEEDPGTAVARGAALAACPRLPARTPTLGGMSPVGESGQADPPSLPGITPATGSADGQATGSADESAAAGAEAGAGNGAGPGLGAGAVNGTGSGLGNGVATGLGGGAGNGPRTGVGSGSTAGAGADPRTGVGPGAANGVGTDGRTGVGPGAGNGGRPGSAERGGASRPRLAPVFGGDPLLSDGRKASAPVLAPARGEAAGVPRLSPVTADPLAVPELAVEPDPPPRPPVEITPLEPPPRRFDRSRRARRDPEPDEDHR
ncbi:Hsp70 family protein [Actinokineospora iranica]|uniref:Hsp70 family protein n=1 Tax=Actinokineospora iranica TaxID=1271860 RepID=UPI0015874A8C|nr:Hsp70 family protein [Actinokineospora iranica]